MCIHYNSMEIQLPHCVSCLYLLLPLPLSALLLLMVWQRQVANFLPFDLQQFARSKETEQTHTHTTTHTHSEEEPRLPWVNWGRGLAKGPGGKWRSFDSGTKVILACAGEPDRLNDHRGGAKRSANMHIWENKSLWRTNHGTVGLKTERSERADQWHSDWKYSSENNVLFYHFKRFTFWITEHFSQNATKHPDSNTVCHLPLNHFFYSRSWVSKNNYTKCCEQLFIRTPHCPWLLNYISFLYNMSKFI